MPLGKQLLKTVLDAGARVIMVIGGPDTGKTTLVEALSNVISEKYLTAVLDLDMGQSHIGPPTTQAWGRVEGGFKGWDNIKTEELYFTGALSPPGNLLPSLAGARRLLDSAASQCARVIIDTTGLISVPVGRIYKQYKIELLMPDIVIGIEKKNELEDMLRPYRFGRKPRVLRVPASRSVRAKSVDTRMEFRAERLSGYFQGSATFGIFLDKVGVRYSGDLEGGVLPGRLISLRDGMQKDLYLGIIEEFHPDKNMITVRSPARKGTEYASIIIGKATAAL